MKQRSVGMVILGAGGYMGSNGIKALPALLQKLSQSNIDLKFLCIAEPVDRKKRPAIRLCKAVVNLPFEKVNWLPDALSKLRGARGDERYPVIIYDATPTTFHQQHLVIVRDNQDTSLLYLGEKPIFTDPFEKKYLTYKAGHDFEFFSELIETENPVFLAVKKYLIKNQRLKISQIWSWRAGCSGIKKAIQLGRLGVEGGALEDKSLHDFSISVGLLGRPHIQAAKVSNAVIHSLILHRDYYFQKANRKSFLTVGNGATKSVRVDLKKEDLLPADGLFSMDVSWQLRERTVPAKYLFSWLGFNNLPEEEPFVNLLNSLGFPLFPLESDYSDLKKRPRRWLDISKPFRSPGRTNTYEAKMQEIRVSVFKCVAGSREKYIVCNFLSKYESKDKLRRYAYVVEVKNGRPEITDELFVEPVNDKSYEEKKADELSSIFFNVINHGLGDSKALFIDRDTSLLVHDVMIKARKQAYRKFQPNNNHWFSIAEEIFAKNITSYRTKHRKT